ncbi:MAG: recombinase family protein [Boseongicola sp.]|nr:recombinase family protein [Boseongicola sp.]
MVRRRLSRRKGPSRILDRLEKIDVLIAPKLDRLGRDVIDACEAVSRLKNSDIRVHCLALGGVDHTSSVGKMTMNAVNAVAQFERNVLIERTQAGLARAKTRGIPLRRPLALSPVQRQSARAQLDGGETISAVACQFITSRQAIMSVRDQHLGMLPHVPS